MHRSHLSGCLKRSAFVLFFQFVAAEAPAQRFFPGFIETASGELRKGFVDFNGGDGTPQHFRFRETQRSPVFTYGKGELSIVEAKGTRFEYAVVETEIAAQTGGLSGNVVEHVRIKEGLYLEVLLSGSRSLYYHRGRHKQFFVKDESGAIEPLVFRIWMEMPEGGGAPRFTEDNLFKDQLSEYLHPYKIPEAELKKLQYTRNSLMNLFQKYYMFRKEIPTGISKTTQLTTTIGMTGGYLHSRLDVDTRYGLPELNAIPVSPSQQAALGFFAEWAFPERSRNLSFYAETLYQNMYYTGNRTTENVSAGTEEYWADYTLHYVRFSGLFRYTHSGFRVQPFVHAGFNVGSLFHHDLQLTTRQTVDGNEQTRTRSVFGYDDPKQFSLGLAGGAGLVYSVCSLEARYERSGRFTGPGTLRARPLNVYLLGAIRVPL